jgi:osomolarity two-component system sensor histidine kinase SLN1
METANSTRLSGLSLTASLKATQLSSTLLLYESQVKSTSTRLLVQSALQRYAQGNNPNFSVASVCGHLLITSFLSGNNTDSNWSRTKTDLESALGTGDILVQSSIFPATSNDSTTFLPSLVNVTSPNVVGMIALPFTSANGSSIYLGDVGLGYPPELYPNITYNATAANPMTAASSNGVVLDARGALFLGPLVVNSTFALMSATV